MKYRIRTKQFCALSQEQKWQSWLQSVCPDLHEDLMNHFKVSTSCKANHIKMMEIQEGLQKRNLLGQMVLFLKQHYPIAVELVTEPQAPVQKPITSQVVRSGSSDVFHYYNPSILTFPHLMILENDDSESLLTETKEFCNDKIGVDFIIVGNKAYIEYFKRKYSKEAKMVREEDRDIYKYRLRNGLRKTDRVAKI